MEQTRKNFTYLKKGSSQKDQIGWPQFVKQPFSQQKQTAL